MKLDFYGVPRFLMKDYLTVLGGREVGEDRFEGDGWQADLSQAPWRNLGSLRLGGTTVEFSGDPAAIEALLPELEKRTQRGGG